MCQRYQYINNLYIHYWGAFVLDPPLTYIINSKFIFIKTEKFTSPNNFLLVLGRRTVAHREDCQYEQLYLYTLMEKGSSDI
jgi:hypothetical protein